MKNLKPSNKVTIVFIALMFLFRFLSGDILVGQTISTVAEIYDYEVGDIFHHGELSGFGGGGQHVYTNIEIIDKYYSPAHDTLYYTCKINTMTITSENPEPVYSSKEKTISYTDLGSPVNSGDIDSVFVGSDYNNRIINGSFKYTYTNYYYFWDNQIYIAGCGGPFIDYYYYSGEYSALLKYTLFYFKKGNEEWGAPFYVGITNPVKEFRLYPNPVSDYFIMEIPEASQTIFTLLIYDCRGKLVSQQNALLGNHQQIDVSSLPSGIYFVRTSDGRTEYKNRFIKL